MAYVQNSTPFFEDRRVLFVTNASVQRPYAAKSPYDPYWILRLSSSFEIHSCTKASWCGTISYDLHTHVPAHHAGNFFVVQQPPAATHKKIQTHGVVLSILIILASACSHNRPCFLFIVAPTLFDTYHYQHGEYIPFYTHQQKQATKEERERTTATVPSTRGAHEPGPLAKDFAARL